MKYSDLLCQYLKEAGYTHCFTLTGGNIMHMIGSCSEYFKIIPVVNEIAAGIAVEYFNESQKNSKAFALVTAGPGLTNIITAVAGAFLESRELLVIGGQVKVSDLSDGKIRQNGIQEIDGVNISKPISKISVRLKDAIGKKQFLEYIKIGAQPRKGPVFIEIPLDVQAKNIDEKNPVFFPEKSINCQDTKECERFNSKVADDIISKVAQLTKSSKRPILLIGGGVERQTIQKLYSLLGEASLSIMTTWNGADRIDSEHQNYFGRPNTWGQRYSNVIIQQCDLLIALGTRLGLQQTGFNWEEFVQKGKIVQVDCDRAELEKGHPKIDLGLNCDANDFLEKILLKDLGNHDEWLQFCRMVKVELPINEKLNNVNSCESISPYSFFCELSKICNKDDIVIPCSSGGAFTVFFQTFCQRYGQIIITNKGLASMGYGLSGAIGASIAMPEKRTILIEGDGGFSQNLQELAMINANNLNLKIFLFENSGYASIRMTQKNYFGGKYVGCDTKTGLGFPNWEKLFDAYDIRTLTISNENFIHDKFFLELFESNKSVAFIVKIDPEQTYFPKISSKVMPDGGMKSSPLHLMHPEIKPELAKKIFKFL